MCSVGAKGKGGRAAGCEWCCSDGLSVAPTAALLGLVCTLRALSVLSSHRGPQCKGSIPSCSHLPLHWKCWLANQLSWAQLVLVVVGIKCCLQGW